MATVTIDQGPIDALMYPREVSQKNWHFLVGARRTYLGIRLAHDCRCLVRFVQEGQDMWQPLGYQSLEDFMRQGLDLDPALVRWALAGLQTLAPDEAIPFAVAVAQGKHVQPHTAEAALHTTGEVLPEGNSTGNNQYQKKVELGNLPSSSSQQSRAQQNGVGLRTQKKLDRLARDFPDLLEKVKRRELSVNRAAKEAGIVKDPDPLKELQKWWTKASDEQRALFLRWLESSTHAIGETHVS